MTNDATTDSKKSTLPLVSFIITYYDLPIDLLCECLDSIMALSLSKAEREIIVVDDGSAYCPMNELTKYGNDIIYIRKANGGLSDARNTGMKMATGRFIQFIDGDDKLNPAPYENCLDTVRFKSPDIVMFSFSARECNDVPYNEVKGPESGTEYMKHNNLHAAACGYVFRSTLAENLRFTIGIYHEDEEFTPQLLLRAETVYSTEVKAYMYRKRKGSITHSENKRNIVKRLDDSLGVIVRLQDLTDTLPMSDSLALRRRIAQLTMDYIYNIMVLTRSADFLEKKIAELEKLGLFPLPDRNYTRKYRLFRRMTSTKLGRRLLIVGLPR